MRLAIVVTPALLHDHRPAPGALDGDLIRARLPLEDTGFRVIDLDPSRDLAEQLDLLFDDLAARGDPSPGAEAIVLFYVSTSVALSAEGELFLCLDPANPSMGDALADIAAVFLERARERASARLLFFIECHHAPAPEDPFASAAIVAAAKQAVDAPRSGISLLVAAHAIDDAHSEMPSPFTRSFVEELDNADPDLGLSAGALYTRIQESERLVGVVPCFTFARGHGAFPLLSTGPELSELDADEVGRLSMEMGRFHVDVEPEATPESAPESAPVSAPAPASASESAPEPAPEPAPASAPASAPAPAPAPASEPEPAPASAPEPAPAPIFALEPEPTPVSVPVSVEEEPDILERPASSPSIPPPPPSIEEEVSVTFDGHTPDPTRISVLLDDQPVSARPAREGSFPDRISVLLEDEPVSAEAPPPAPSAPPPAKSAPPPAPSAPPPAKSAPPPAPSAPPPAKSAPPPAKSVPPPGRSAPPPPLPGQSVPAPGWSAPPVESPYGPAEQYISEGDRLIARKDLDAALSEYKKALAVLGLAQKRERAEVHVRIANVRWQQDRRREAIASFEKALQITPEHRPALEALITLNVHEGDWRGVHSAEERFLASVEREDERFRHLVQFAERWHGDAGDPARARATYERARAIRPDDLDVLVSLRRLYESANAIEDAVEARRRIAEVTQEPREKAREYFELGQYLLEDLEDEERGLRMLDLALESDPSLLEPLELVAQVLADRHEYGQLELAYRRMLGRVARIPSAAARREVRWELSRRLGLLFRDHLEDPGSALTAFEDALEAKPDDLPTLLTAADIARAAGRLDRAAAHLATAAAIEPGDAALYHQLFDVYQKLRRPDQAWAATSVLAELGELEARERFIHDEHRPDGVPRFRGALRSSSWERLRPADRDRNVEGVLMAVAEAAIDARIAQRTGAGTLPQLDPRARQDPQQSTVSVVRTFAWASHLLGVTPPAVYLREDSPLNLAAIMADHPAVIAGGGALRGRSMPELSFLVGSHLAYHAGPHRLLLYYPSIDEVAACFLAAVSLVRPTLPIPPALEGAARDLAPELDARLYGGARDQLFAAVEAFEEAGARADLTHWAGAVERCAARAGYLLCGDLAVASRLVRDDAAGLLAPEEKIGDLYGFTVSEDFYKLRRELGIAVED